MCVYITWSTSNKLLFGIFKLSRLAKGKTEINDVLESCDLIYPWI